LLSHNLVRLDLSWDTKICNFYITFAVKENIVQFDISVRYILRMSVA